MGAKKQTIGFHYLFSILFGIGRGPIDELRAIKVGDKIAWEGNLCTGEAQIIDQPDLFGGEKKEGGVQGLFRLNQGAANQVLPGETARVISGRGPYGRAILPDITQLITSETGGEMGELRGRVTLWFDGLVASMNPYIKEWSFRVRRSRAGWHNNDPWYPEKATIFMSEGRIFAMNPAHIIYECCTNPSWARGLPREMLDENSFVLAANTLCAEGFGLCFVWFRQEDIDAFIQTVVNHIGATLYTDRETGKVTLKLIRNDYVAGETPLFTPSSGLLDIQEDDSGSTDTMATEVIVTGHDPINDEAIQVRVHNLAAFRAQQAVSAVEQTYKGLPTAELCLRVAQRDLAASAAGLRKFKVTLDRRGFKIHPGGVFRISAPSRGIAQIVLRAGEIDDGNILNGRIVIDAVQDVFGVPLTSFVKPTENTWTPPSDEAVPAIREMLTEATYRQLYLTEGQAVATGAVAGQSYIVAMAARPSRRSNSYQLLSRADGETAWLETGEHFFTGSALLAADVGPTDTSFVVENWSERPEEDPVGQAIYVAGEYMRVDGYDPDTETLTVARGTIDTYPLAHSAGSVVWLADDDGSSDARVYHEGELVEAKVLPRTFAAILAEADAAEMAAEMQGRPVRPYPPADIKVGGDSVYEMVGLYPEPAVTWAQRNRITQADALLGFFEGTVEHEVGTTYTIRIYGSPLAGSPLATHENVTSGWVYDGATQIADETDGFSTLWFEIVSVRDGIESLAPARYRLVLKAGWGYGWGQKWGGAA